MKIDEGLLDNVRAMFAPLNQQPAATAFPALGSLSIALNASLPPGSKGPATTNVTQHVATMFATAAVNMWMRAVHSFLVSAALTNVSPIWASVSGYYSSHYSVRAVAHVLGFYQLFIKKRIVQLQLEDGRYICAYQPKSGGDREHRVYWKIVKKNEHFAQDPFFTENSAGEDESDVGHRDRANYADHLPQFPNFRPLDAAEIKDRIDRISEIEVSSAPIPRVSQYPDLESVQIVAYHRLVRFRDFVDALVGVGNRFWRVHRDPPWAREFMDFQITEETTLRTQFERQ